MSRMRRVVCDGPAEKRPRAAVRPLVEDRRPWALLVILTLLALALLAAGCDSGRVLSPQSEQRGAAAAADSARRAARAAEFVRLAFADNPTLIRWEIPVRISIPVGGAEDSAIVGEVLAEIGEIIGQTPSLVSADGNLLVEFLPPSRTPCGIDACWQYPTQPPLTWGHVWVSSQLAPDAQRGAVRVILASVMGLGGYSDKPESLFNANGNASSDFSELDRWVFRALYDRSLHSGMSRQEAYAAVLALP